MTNEVNKYTGVSVNVSKPFTDVVTGEDSIVIRYFLEKLDSDELCFCDIQFPQEIVINNHHMTKDEVNAMLIYYDHFHEDLWRMAYDSSTEKNEFDS